MSVVGTSPVEGWVWSEHRPGQFALTNGVVEFRTSKRDKTLAQVVAYERERASRVPGK